MARPAARSTHRLTGPQNRYPTPATPGRTLAILDKAVAEGA